MTWHVSRETRLANLAKARAAQAGRPRTPAQIAAARANLARARAIRAGKAVSVTATTQRRTPSTTKTRAAKPRTPVTQKVTKPARGLAVHHVNYHGGGAVGLDAYEAYLRSLGGRGPRTR